MKLGVFDSGLGGLLITKAIRAHFPDIDLVYFGDTLHVPYGSRSDEAIYQYTKTGIDFLFEQDCQLIIVACNTASAAALRRLQQQYLPKAYPERRVLGVVVPTLEAALDRGIHNIGLIGTNYIVNSNIYEEELKKLDSRIQIHAQATPLLVPLIENEGGKWLPDVLETYLQPLKEKGAECLVLGCTHYPFLKEEVRKVWGNDLALLSQDEIIPDKLADYLERHPEIDRLITRNGSDRFCVSDLTPSYLQAARKIYDPNIQIEKVDLHEPA